MPTLRLFAQARVSAGIGSDIVDGATIDEVVAAAVLRYGPEFERVLATCRVWLNGDEAPGDTPVGETDEIAIIPPVSGGGVE